MSGETLLQALQILQKYFKNGVEISTSPNPQCEDNTYIILGGQWISHVSSVDYNALSDLGFYNVLGISGLVDSVYNN